jgi:hypothetical protein
MTRAIEMGRQRCKADREQLDEFLRERPWREVGEFAAYGCQCATLKLKPWQSPPCEVDPDWADDTGDDHHGRIAAARLLRRLLAAGLSRYEPDPVAALERAERIEAAE